MPELKRLSAIKIVFPPGDESFLRLAIDNLVAILPTLAQSVQAEAEFDLGSLFFVLHHPDPDKIPDLKKMLEDTRLGIEFLY